MSGTQQLILLNFLIIRRVSSDQTDFIRDLTLNREPKIKLNYTPFIHRDLRYILRVFVEGVLLFTPLLEHAFVL